MAVDAFDSTGERIWQSYVAGAVYYPPAVAHDRLFVGAADGRVYAFEAATGQPLWNYRVAPNDERIPVYGQLISRWPVAGGIVVQDNTVYAAAGIAHYDGTYVVALDANSGQLLARNDTSGRLSPEVNGGVSLQGQLTIVDDELRFLGGGVYETARYDLQSLACLNSPQPRLSSQFHTAFYAYYPEYGKYVSVDHTRSDGTSLVLDASYEGSRFSPLMLQSALPAGVPTEPKDAARWYRRNPSTKRKALWTDQSQRRLTAYVVSDDSMLIIGHAEGHDDQPFIANLDPVTGAERWQATLPALAVKGGIAMDAQRRVLVTLENGQLVCFEPDDA